ncbi:hypothetical protein ACLOJK_000793 [Asimina triloba]
MKNAPTTSPGCIDPSTSAPLTLAPSTLISSELDPARPVIHIEFSALLKMMKNLQQQLSRAQVDALQYHLTYTQLELALVLTTSIAPPATISPVQLVPNKFDIPEMPVFEPNSNSTSHVVNYNIHMDLRITFEGLKCQAFPANFNEQGKTWFASLAPGSIPNFNQLTDLFKAQFSN